MIWSLRWLLLLQKYLEGREDNFYWIVVQLIFCASQLWIVLSSDQTETLQKLLRGWIDDAEQASRGTSRVRVFYFKLLHFLSLIMQLRHPLAEMKVICMLAIQVVEVDKAPETRYIFVLPILVHCWIWILSKSRTDSDQNHSYKERLVVTLSTYFVLFHSQSVILTKLIWLRLTSVS